jgi:hypothetical protein
VDVLDNMEDMLAGSPPMWLQVASIQFRDKLFHAEHG